MQNASASLLFSGENVWEIRSYLNTDTPALSKIWAQHHQACLLPAPTSNPALVPSDKPSPSPSSGYHIHRDPTALDLQSRGLECKPAVWDACIFSKAYFRADELLLAISETGEAVGFIHFGMIPPRSTAGQSEMNSIGQASIGAIHRLCVSSSPSEDSIAESLIQQAVARLKTAGATVCQGLGGGEHSVFYLGIAEGDNSMGVLAHDRRSQNWFHRAGFAPIQPTECWELELASFRPPMDRMQIQVRRNCTIGRMLEEDYDDWLESAVLGHCEQVRFHLMVKSPPMLAGILKCWFPDPEVADVDSGVVRTRIPELPETETERERFIYLLSESLRQLQQDRKRVVRTVTSAQKQNTISVLQKLGFRSVVHGLLFEKQLD
jgi:hypothetical protein